MFKKNVQYSHKKKLSAWRKIAIGTWTWAGDPSVYGTLELSVDKALQYIKNKSELTSERITLTHFFGKAIAEVYKKYPDLNCVLRFGYLHQRKNVDIFFQAVSNQQGEDLSGVTIRNIDQKSLIEIASEMNHKSQKLKTDGDHDDYSIKNFFRLVPPFLTRFLLNTTAIITYKLNIWSKLMGAPQDPLGSVMITNVGSLGITHAYAPLVPYSHCPAVIALGAITEKPVVINKEIKIASIISVGITFDHRLIDGFHAAKMSKMIKEIFDNPEQLK